MTKKIKMGIIIAAISVVVLGGAGAGIGIALTTNSNNTLVQMYNQELERQVNKKLKQIIEREDLEKNNKIKLRQLTDIVNPKFNNSQDEDGGCSCVNDYLYFSNKVVNPIKSSKENFDKLDKNKYNDIQKKMILSIPSENDVIPKDVNKIVAAKKASIRQRLEFFGEKVFPSLSNDDVRKSMNNLLSDQKIAKQITNEEKNLINYIVKTKKLEVVKAKELLSNVLYRQFDYDLKLFPYISFSNNERIGFKNIISNLTKWELLTLQDALIDLFNTSLDNLKGLARFNLIKLRKYKLKINYSLKRDIISYTQINEEKTIIINKILMLIEFVFSRHMRTIRILDNSFDTQIIEKRSKIIQKLKSIMPSLSTRDKEQEVILKNINEAKTKNINKTITMTNIQGMSYQQLLYLITKLWYLSKTTAVFDYPKLKTLSENELKEILKKSRKGESADGDEIFLPNYATARLEHVLGLITNDDSLKLAWALYPYLFSDNKLIYNKNISLNDKNESIRKDLNPFHLNLFKEYIDTYPDNIQHIIKNLYTIFNKTDNLNEKNETIRKIVKDWTETIKNAIKAILKKMFILEFDMYVSFIARMSFGTFGDTSDKKKTETDEWKILKKELGTNEKIENAMKNGNQIGKWEWYDKAFASIYKTSEQQLQTKGYYYYQSLWDICNNAPYIKLFSKKDLGKLNYVDSKYSSVTKMINAKTMIPYFENLYSFYRGISVKDLIMAEKAKTKLTN